MIPLPPLSFSGGSSRSDLKDQQSIATTFSGMFNNDNSGWNVQVHSQGNQTATGSTGMGTQKPDTSLGGGVFAGDNTSMMFLFAGLAWLLLKK